MDCVGLLQLEMRVVETQVVFPMTSDLINAVCTRNSKRLVVLKNYVQFQRASQRNKSEVRGCDGENMIVLGGVNSSAITRKRRAARLIYAGPTP